MPAAVNKYSVHSGAINAIAHTPLTGTASHIVVTASDDKTAKLHLIESGSCATVATLVDIEGAATSVALTCVEDERQSIAIVVGTSKGRLHTFSADIGMLLENCAQEAISRLQAASDVATLITASTIDLSSAVTILPTVTAVHHHEEIASIALCSIQQSHLLCASIDDDGALVLSDALKGTSLWVQRKAHDVLGSAVCFSDVTYTLGAGPRSFSVWCATGGFDQKINVWEVYGGITLQTVKEKVEVPDESISILATPHTPKKRAKDAKKAVAAATTSVETLVLTCEARKVCSWTAGDELSAEISATSKRVGSRKEKAKDALLPPSAAPSPAHEGTLADVDAGEESMPSASAVSDGKLLNPAFVVSLAHIPGGSAFIAAFGNGEIATYDVETKKRLSVTPIFMLPCVNAVVLRDTVFALADNGTISMCKLVDHKLVRAAGASHVVYVHPRAPNALIAVPERRSDEDIDGVGAVEGHYLVVCDTSRAITVYS